MDVRFDGQGLIPAVVIHAATGEVLTLAYMNAESLERTQQTGESWFYSRSRQALWHKGETSGHTQRVVSIAPDCDADALVVRVIPNGPACHNGTASCWTGPHGGAVRQLDEVLEQRATDRPAGSYTTKLLEEQNLRIKKLGEEGAEVIQALLMGSDESAIGEASDLIYHLAVALRARGISFAQVEAELLRRHMK